MYTWRTTSTPATTAPNTTRVTIVPRAATAVLVTGDGSGYGNGSGNGDGDGYGDGYGNGNGYGDGS